MTAEESDNDQTRSFVALTAGANVSHYRIIEKIGAGGMGEVYLAEDTKLKRKVALKFLPLHLCQDDDCRTRFKREAQAAAKLSHPNIVHIYEVSEYKGRPFFAMEHIEGQSLRELSKGKELGIDRIIELAIQVCDGLGAAHDKKVVHRDIKPSNIVIDAYGRPKILDFGLAAIQGGEHLTKTGSTLGTVRYMSPEQVEGKAVDHGSDLFSLGVVLYELIASRTPFEKENEAATLKAITQDNPEPLARYKADIPDELQRTVSKLLEKDPSMRYQSASGVISDLKRLVMPAQSSIVVTPAKRPRRWPLLAGVGVVVVMGALAWYSFQPEEETDKSTGKKMLAVLPFENLGAVEDEYFADGITDEITSRLAKLSELRVISRTSAIQYKDTDKGLPQIAGELGVDYILEGTIRWDKAADISRVRITPQLIRVSDNTHLWTDRYDAVIDDIFAVQASIAETVAEELDITLLESERQALNEQMTKNTEAYDFYLKGHEYFNNHSAKDYINAEEMLLKAIDLEPDFALAYAWLSVVHTQIYANYLDRTDERLKAVKEAVDRALEIAPDLSDAQGALAWYHFKCLKDYDRALEEFTILREKQPSDATNSLCIAKIELKQGKWENAVADFQRAIRLNPRSSTFCNEYGFALRYLRRYDEAESLFNRTIELKPDMHFPYHNKYLLYLHCKGDINAAREVLQEALQKNDRWSDLTDYEALTLLNDVRDISEITAYDSAYYYYLKGDVYRYMNQAELKISSYDSARTILERIVSTEPKNSWYHADMGVTYAGLGRKQEAIREGQLAVELLPVSEDAIYGTNLVKNLAIIYAIVGEYDLAIELLDYLLSIPSEVSVPWLRIWPDFAPMRDHPRFQALLEKYENKHE